MAGQKDQGVVIDAAIDEAGLHRVGDGLFEPLPQDAYRLADGIRSTPSPWL